MRLSLAITALTAAALAFGCNENTTSTPTSAETMADVGMPHRAPIRHLLTKLDLTSEQQTALDSVFVSHRAEFEELRGRAKDSASRAAFRKAHMNLRDKIRAEVATVLTERQRDELEQLVTEFHSKPHEPPTEQELAERLEKHLERLTTELTLTPEQQEQVRTLLKSRQTERVEHLGQPLDPEMRHERHKAFRVEMQKLLTAEQYAKLEEMHSSALRHGFGAWHGSE